MQNKAPPSSRDFSNAAQQRGQVSSTPRLPSDDAISREYGGAQYAEAVGKGYTFDCQ